MNSMAQYVYNWMMDDFRRPSMTNQQIRNELHVAPRYIRQAKAAWRQEQSGYGKRPTDRTKQEQQRRRNVRRFGYNVTRF